MAFALKSRPLYGLLLSMACMIMLSACVTLGPHGRTPRSEPLDPQAARAQVDDYVRRSSGQNRKTVEAYSQALLGEHRQWVVSAILELERDAATYSATTAFVHSQAMNRPPVRAAFEITQFPGEVRGSGAVVPDILSGATHDMPFTRELILLNQRFHRANQTGSSRAKANAHAIDDLVQRKAEAEKNAERAAAQAERNRKFDTSRRRAEQCSDKSIADWSREPTRNELCGALLSDFDHRARGYEENMGWLDALVSGESPEGIRTRGSLLVTITSFTKHGRCKPARRGDRHGFQCAFSANVQYSDHRVLGPFSVIPEIGAMKEVSGFFYIGPSRRWETNQ